MAINIPFAFGSYKHESRAIASIELVNLFPVAVEKPAPSKAALMGTGGIVEIATSGLGETGRGGILLGEIPYFVQSSKLYRLDRTATIPSPVYAAVDVSGAVSITGTEQVILAASDDEIMIIDTESASQFNAWSYTVSGGLVQVSDSDFDGPVADCDYQNSRFVFTKADGKKFFVSDVGTGLAYTATAFGNAVVNPDPTRGITNINNQLFVYGSETCETFQGRPDKEPFPYQRIEGQVLEKGIVSAKSLTEFNGYAVWLGGGKNETPRVWASNGGEPVQLSDDALDYQLSTYTDSELSQAFMQVLGQGNRHFLRLTIPGQTTWVYDRTASEMLKTRAWHEHKSYDSGEIPSRIAGIVQAYGGIIVSDSTTNKIGVLSRTTFSEYGEPIRARFTTPFIDNGGDPFVVDSFEIVVESGTVPLSVDPLAELQISEDGLTWESYGTQSVGTTGQAGERLIWEQLGWFERQCAFRGIFAYEGTEKRVIYKAEANISG